MLLDALRSGQYERTTGCLRRGHKYCALGVLCELYRLEFPDKAKWCSPFKQIPETDDGVYLLECASSTKCKSAGLTLLPSEVQDWAGLPDRVGSIVVKEGEEERRYSMMNANDDVPLDDPSFNAVIALLEKDSSTD